MHTAINSKQAPTAIGPYSQAIRSGNTLYCSGQIALDPETGQMIQSSLEAETEQVLDNLGAVLKESNLSYADVVQCTVYLVDMKDYAVVNEIYARYFSEAPPARVTVAVSELPRNGRVEISCIAVG